MNAKKLQTAKTVLAWLASSYTVTLVHCLPHSQSSPYRFNHTAHRLANYSHLFSILITFLIYCSISSYQIASVYCINVVWRLSRVHVGSAQCRPSWLQLQQSHDEVMASNEFIDDILESLV